MPAPHPYSLLAELTYRCPLKCPYCSNPLELRLERELDTATWQRVLAEAADLGVVQVHFSGGEPLVRGTSLRELVSHARSVNLYTHLITSGIGADENRLATAGRRTRCAANQPAGFAPGRERLAGRRRAVVRAKVAVPWKQPGGSIFR